jgi:ABC-2 type transport system permease protein
MSADAMPTAVSEGALAALLRKKHTNGSASAFSSVYTLAWRAMLKIKHVPFQLFDVTAFPIMMTLLFTFLFGGAIAGDPGIYIQYMLPGVLVQTIIFITVYTGVGLNTDISKGVFDRFRSLPMWQPSPVFGALLGDLFRFLIAAFIVMGLGLAIGFRPAGGALGMLAALGLVLVLAFSLSWIWIIVAMLVKQPESVMTTSFLLLFPVTFISDIFVPSSTMPGWLQGVVTANPVTHLATASRGLMHGVDVTGNVVAVLIASAVITAIFAPIALKLYHRER